MVRGIQHGAHVAASAVWSLGNTCSPGRARKLASDAVWQADGSLAHLPESLKCSILFQCRRHFSAGPQSNICPEPLLSKGLQGIKVLLPVLKLVGVVCASRMRLVTNSP